MAQKFSLLCQHYAQCFQVPIMLKILCQHNRRVPTLASYFCYANFNILHTQKWAAVSVMP